MNKNTMKKILFVLMFSIVGAVAAVASDNWENNEPDFKRKITESERSDLIKRQLALERLYREIGCHMGYDYGDPSLMHECQESNKEWRRIQDTLDYNKPKLQKKLSPKELRQLKRRQQSLKDSYKQLDCDDLYNFNDPSQDYECPELKQKLREVQDTLDYNKE